MKLYLYLLPCQQYSSHLPVLAQHLYVIIKIMKGVITAGTLVIKNITIPSVCGETGLVSMGSPTILKSSTSTDLSPTRMW